MISYHEIFPTKAEAEAFMEGVLQNYHPVGYGTYFYPLVEQEDGTWLVTGYRAASCD